MDPRKQRLLLIVIGGFTVVVWVHGLTVRPIHSRPSPSSPVAPAAGPPAEGSAAAPVPSHFTEWGRNPFESDRGVSATATSLAPATPSGYILNGILWDPAAPSAIINNHVVMVGSHLDQWRVVEIHKDRVVLSNGRTTQTLSVD